MMVHQLTYAQQTSHMVYNDKFVYCLKDTEGTKQIINSFSHGHDTGAQLYEIWGSMKNISRVININVIEHMFNTFDKCLIFDVHT